MTHVTNIMFFFIVFIGFGSVLNQIIIYLENLLHAQTEKNRTKGQFRFIGYVGSDWRLLSLSLISYQLRINLFDQRRPGMCH